MSIRIAHGLLMLYDSRMHEIMRRERGEERDRELLSHLRHEVTAKTHDLHTTRGELQSSHHKNERLSMELETMKSNRKLTSAQKLELERLDSINSSLVREMENIKKNVRGALASRLMCFV